MAHKTPTERRKARVRRAIKAAANGRMRLTVHRSSKHIYAQVIDDTKGVTLASASSLEKAQREAGKTGADVEAAKASRPWSSIAAATCITGASRRSPTPLAKAD
jgi:large subunit ribosomal protein L18